MNNLPIKRIFLREISRTLGVRWYKIKYFLNLLTSLRPSLPISLLSFFAFGLLFTVIVGDHVYMITVSQHKIFVSKRHYSPQEPVPA